MDITVFTGESRNKFAISVKKDDDKNIWVIDGIYSDILNRQPLYVWSGEMEKLTKMIKNSNNVKALKSTIESYAQSLEKHFT